MIIAIQASIIAYLMIMLDPKPYLQPNEPGRCWRRSERRFYDTAPRRHAELVALHVLKGSMRYLIDGHILDIGPRTLLWAFSDQAHLLLSDSADFDMWVMIFARSTLAANPHCPPVISHAAQGKIGAFILKQDHHEQLADLAASLRTKPDSQWLQAGLIWWAIRAWDACDHGEAAKGNRTHPAVQRAIEAIEADPTQNIAEIAGAAHQSPSHLGHLFRKEIGQTIAGYRTQTRLNAVDRMMNAPHPPPLLNAAIDAGFGSYSQFYRAFTNACGINPWQFYQRTNKGETIANG